MNTVPEPTLRRLPVYYHYLKNLLDRGILEISTTVMSNDLKLDPTQVRKDLGYTGIIGKPKVGFEVPEVIKSIEKFLNWNNMNDAFLVGAGNLGLAMLGYNRFKEYGINIIAAFDNDETKIGLKIDNVEVFPISKLSNLASRMHIHIGILTVPRSSAQEAADIMVESGIKAIWNFAPTSLKVPEDVIVENATFTNSLGVLTRKLFESLS